MQVVAFERALAIRRERKRALDGDEAAGALEARRVLGDEPAGSPLEAHRELDADVRHEPSPKMRRWLREESPHEEAPHEHALHEHTLARLTCSPEDALGPLLDEHALGLLDAQRVLGDEACGPLG